MFQFLQLKIQKYKLKHNKHEFALFFKELSSYKGKDEVILTDGVLIQRITMVLRLSKEESLVLFDACVHVECVLKSIDKKQLTFAAHAWKQNNKLAPKITVLLPVLKREALDAAVYSCAALGASAVQLITTAKTRAWGGKKELERLQRVIIAAAEQSKNFAMPLIYEPSHLSDALQKYVSVETKLFADVSGTSLSGLLAKADFAKDFLLLVGPEGDLTDQEKELVKNSFSFCVLTSTIVRAEQALALLLGVVVLKR